MLGFSYMIPGKWPKDWGNSYPDILDTSVDVFNFLSTHPRHGGQQNRPSAFPRTPSGPATKALRNMCLWADPLQYDATSETRVDLMAHSISHTKSSKKLQQNTLRLGFGVLIQLDTRARALVLGVAA